MSSKTLISIFTPKRFFRIATNDVRKIVRDPTLLAVLIFSILPAILFYFFSDWMNVTANTAFALPNITFYAAPVFFILPAYLIGWIVGFLILEERDEGPLLALEVTPVGKAGIALFRASLACTLVFSIAVVTAPILLAKQSIATWLILSFFAALQAVTITFALPAIANNKVQGLAFTKVVNLFMLVPLLGAIATPWRFLAGIFPSFWVGEYLNLSHNSWLSLSTIALIGLLVHMGFVLLFYRTLLSRK